MSIALISLLIPVVLILGMRGIGARGGPRESLGTAVRRFFQFAVQFALVAVVATGLSGLIGRLLQRNVLVAGDRNALAQGLSFTLVGVPFLWLLARWTARRLAAEPREALSTSWGWYLSLAELVPLAVFTVALTDVVLWIARSGPYDGDAVARALVWGAAWAVHRRVCRATSPPGTLRDHELAGSAFGLWSAAIGLAMFVGEVLRAVVGVSGKELLADANHPIARAATSLVVGAAVWFVYWIRSAHSARRTLHWHVYVLLVGVAAGLVAAIASASVVLYDVLVWFLGDPGTSLAAAHFNGSIKAVGWFVAGVLVWWYHRTVLGATGPALRDEARRVYEYVVSIIALAAAAVGIVILLVALVESLTSSALIAGPGAGNTLLLAATLLVVGAPLWWWFWRGIRLAVAADPTTESASPTRRVYLFVLFGVVGVAALIALLVVASLLFNDLVAGSLGAATVRSMRWGIGILVTAAAVASYHWRVYRDEREASPVAARRSVLLIGSSDVELVGELRRRLGVRVDGWARLDGDATEWSAVAVQDALAGVDGDDVVVIAVAGALRALAVERE